MPGRFEGEVTENKYLSLNSQKSKYHIHKQITIQKGLYPVKVVKQSALKSISRETLKTTLIKKPILVRFLYSQSSCDIPIYI